MVATIQDVCVHIADIAIIANSTLQLYKMVNGMMNVIFFPCLSSRFGTRQDRRGSEPSLRVTTEGHMG